MELQVIQNKIYEIRGERVMFDFDLAEMYEIQTKVLKQAVRRNMKRFPPDFMLVLTPEEWEPVTNCDQFPKLLKHSQSEIYRIRTYKVILDKNFNLIFQNGTSSWGGNRKLSSSRPRWFGFAEFVNSVSKPARSHRSSNLESLNF